MILFQIAFSFCSIKISCHFSRIEMLVGKTQGSRFRTDDATKNRLIVEMAKEHGVSVLLIILGDDI